MNLDKQTWEKKKKGEEPGIQWDLRGKEEDERP